MWLWCVGERGRIAVCDARVFLGKDAVSAKKLNHGNPLVILGVMVELQPDGLKASVAPDKAEKWAVGVRRALDEKRLSQSDATRLGGRMNFLNANAFGRCHALRWVPGECARERRRCGRAMLRPIYAQQNRPLRGARLSEQLRTSLKWCLDVLEMGLGRTRPFRVCGPCVTILTDARGSPARLGAVAYFAERREWTTLGVEGEISFETRNDSQIVGLELAAVAMAVAAWSRDLEGARLRVFIDNTAAEAMLVKGRGKRVAGGACDRGAPQISQSLGPERHSQKHLAGVLKAWGHGLGGTRCVR